MSERSMIALDYPIEADGVRLERLSIRRPKVRDLLTANKSGGGDEVAREIRLFANLCEVAPEVIEDLDMADYGKLQDAYAGFTSGSQTKRA